MKPSPYYRRSNRIPFKTGVLLVIAIISTTACQSSLFESHITPAPTPQCVEPTLTLGTIKFGIGSVTREADGLPKIPENKKDTAFWVEGTTINYVFGLSPTKDHLNLNTMLKAGDPIVINWADCSRDDYVVASVETIEPNDASFFDQSSGGVTVYVQNESATLVIHGERPVVQSNEIPEATSESSIQIDLQILDFTQPDDQTIQFRINLTNQGANAITLTDEDIALIADNGPEVAALKIEPVMPQELRPGDILPLTLIFPKPQGTSAVLRIFDVTFEEYFQ